MSNLKYLSTWFVFLIGSISFIYLPVFFFPTNIYYILLSFILVLSFLFGYFLSDFSKKRKEYKYISKFDFKKVKLLIIVIYLIYVYIYINFIGAETGAYADKYAHESQISLYMQLLDRPSKLILIFLLSCIVYDSKRNYMVVSALYLLISLSSNTRFDFILSAVYWVGYGAYLGYFRIKFIYIFMSLIILPFLAAVLLLKRVMVFESNNIIHIFSELYERLSLEIIMDAMYNGIEIFTSYLTGMAVINDGFIHPLSGIVRILFLAIPRTIWLEKPESISRIIAKEYFPGAYSAGGGQIAGPIGDAYINGGALGVVIIWVLVGFFSSRSYALLKSNFHLSPSPYKVYIWLMYFNFLSYLIYVMRGFGSDFLWTFLFQLIIIKIIFSIFFRRVPQ